MCKLALAALLLMPSFLPGQGNLLTVTPPPKQSAKKNTVLTTKLDVQLRPGYHVNSNTPADDYLIPLRLTWATSPLEVQQVSYPKPEMEKYEFSEKPISVFSGGFAITTQFKVPAGAAPGMMIITGKLRYQACSNKECFPPKTLEVKLPVDIVN